MNTVNGLISVIIPVYNTREYLNECMESVINQNYTKLEIIVVDDGSTDGCSKICDAWGIRDERIKILHQENMGLSAARNNGVKISSGDYISFIDSDDYIEKDYFELMLSSILENNSDIVASEVKKIYKNAETIYPIDNDTIYTPESALKTVILGTTFTVMSWNKLYKRDLIIDNQFPEGRFHEDDFVMYKIISTCSKLSFCKGAIYYYRQRTHGIIGLGLEKRFDDKYNSFFQNQSFIKNNFPNLQLNMKLLLLQYVTDDYAELINGNGQKNEEQRNRIKKYKSKIRFSLFEILQMNQRQLKKYILSLLFFDIYCQRRHYDIIKWKSQYEYFD